MAADPAEGECILAEMGSSEETYFLQRQAVWPEWNALRKPGWP